MPIRKFLSWLPAFLAVILILMGTRICLPSSADNIPSSPKIPEQSSEQYTSRKPKYLTLSELDGEPVGVQTGVDDWAKFAEKIFPHSRTIYYNTFADIIAALETHKIEAFFVDEPVYNLMAAENRNLARIDEKVGDSYNSYAMR